MTFRNKTSKNINKTVAKEKISKINDEWRDNNQSMNANWRKRGNHLSCWARNSSFHLAKQTSNVITYHSTHEDRFRVWKRIWNFAISILFFFSKKKFRFSSGFFILHVFRFIILFLRVWFFPKQSQKYKKYLIQLWNFQKTDFYFCFLD